MILCLIVLLSPFALLASETLVTFRSVDSIAIGMPIDALGDKETWTVKQQGGQYNCANWLITSPEGKTLYALTMDNRIVRLETTDYPALGGVKAGDTVAHVREVYEQEYQLVGRPKSDGQALDVFSGNVPENGMQFSIDTENQTIMTIRVGTREALTLTEGCS